MALIPEVLKKGDKVAIVCPAKKLPKPMDDAIKLLQSWGLEVVLGDTVNASYHQFAGTDNERTKDLQRFINDKTIKAIFAARGGYGCVRIIDELDFSPLKQHPKWLIGFSDITVLHSHLFANFGLQTLHAQMPVNIPDSSSAGISTLKKALFGEEITYRFASAKANKLGHASGQIIGGNLSLLVSVSGSVSDMDFDDKILFLEDVSEYLYNVDRMLFTLKRAGKLTHLKGLIIGGFTELKDNDIPFGFTVEEIINHVVEEYNYPVCYCFPAGHIADNQAIILGKQIELSVNNEEVNINYLG